MRHIVPAILSDSIQTVQDQLFRVKNESTLQRVQVDIIDPEFVDNLTIHPIDLLEVTTYGLEIDIHLMTNDPIDSVIECTHIKEVKTVIAQIERMSSQQSFCENVRSHGLECGLALDLYTPVDEIDHSVLSTVAIIQVMGNKAGHQGQRFAGELVLSKMRELNDLKIQNNFNFIIAQDIGVTPETIQSAEQAGASMFMVGNLLWKSSNLQDVIDELSTNR